jgi:hypothetical protein
LYLSAKQCSTAHAAAGTATQQEQATNPIAMNDATRTGKNYTIRVREKLDRRWEEWFNGMVITTDSEGTLLTGGLPDQSAWQSELLPEK